MGICTSTCYRRKWEHKTITLALVGLDNAGKTTLCSLFAGEEPDPSVTPTVGFRSVKFRRHRFDVTMYDLGGGESIRAIWTSYFMEVFGLLFVVDSSCPSSRLCEARLVLEETLGHSHICGKPILVIANKTDKEEHLSEADIMAGLGLDNFTNCPLKMVMMSAMQTSRIKILQACLDWLLKKIQELMDTLEPRVMEDTRVAQEARHRQREERRVRVKQLNEERELQEKKEEESGQLGVCVIEDCEDDIVVVCGDPFKPLDVEQLKIKEQLLQKKQQLRQQRMKEFVTHDDDDDIVVVGEHALRPSTGNGQVDDIHHMTGTGNRQVDGMQHVTGTGNSQVDSIHHMTGTGNSQVNGIQHMTGRGKSQVNGMQHMTETEQNKQHIDVSIKERGKKYIFFRSNKIAPYNYKNDNGTAPINTKQICTAPISEKHFGTATISERHVGTAPISERHVGTALITERHVGTATISKTHVGTAPICEKHVGTAPISLRHVGTAPISERHVGTVPISERHVGTAPISERHVGTAPISERDNGTAPMSGLGCTIKYTSPAKHNRNTQFTSIRNNGPDVDSMFSGKCLPPVDGCCQNSGLQDMYHDDDDDVVFRQIHTSDDGGGGGCGGGSTAQD